jgi:hypothetical protein
MDGLNGHVEKCSAMKVVSPFFGLWRETDHEE